MNFCGLELAHPIVNASGTFDVIAARRVFGDALLEDFPFAAFVSKTVTLEPREGNPPPRLFELPAGMINSIGLPNKGLEGYLEHDLPELAALPVPLIVNVMGFTREQVATLVTAFSGRDEVAASAPMVVPVSTFGQETLSSSAATSSRPENAVTSAATCSRVKPMTLTISGTGRAASSGRSCSR